MTSVCCPCNAQPATQTEIRQPKAVPVPEQQRAKAAAAGVCLRLLAAGSHLV